MGYEEKPCQCGNHFIVNRTYWECNDCNYVRLHGKTRFEVALEKKKSKPNKIYRLKRKPFKRAKNSFKKKEISEKRLEVLRKDRETYFKVFNSKPHKCEECGEPLPDVFEDYEGNIVAIYRFSHILSKRAYPEFRHSELNINLLCLNCHQTWEFGYKKSMKIYENNQKIIQKMKDDYNNLK